VATTYRRTSGPAEFRVCICSLRRAARAIAWPTSSPRSRRQRVGIVLEPLQTLGRGQVLAPNLGVELGHDPVELFERAAEPLAVLLGEFGPL
jgi:hypothetical protein